MKKTILHRILFGVVFLFFANPLRASDLELNPSISQDIHRLWEKAFGPDVQLDIVWNMQPRYKYPAWGRVTMPLSAGTAKFLCGAGQKGFRLQIDSDDTEGISTAYYFLRQVGFLFPHPRWEIIPEKKQILKNCNRTWNWRPRLAQRGFHLHTMHPSEWVDAFFLGNFKAGRDLIWWLVRNQQNLLQIQLVQRSDEELLRYLAPLTGYAQHLGLKVGLSASFAMIQQRSYNLIPFWRAFLDFNSQESLDNKIRDLASMIPFDFLSVEMGSSEFTSTKSEKTLGWMNQAGSTTRDLNKKLFIKVHASTNQQIAGFGNFNFLPMKASPLVGVLPHTVFVYGLNDKNTPMYGRRDYADMREFYVRESSKRESLYYPETSYWVFMDMDVPVFLTDYLVARTADVDWMETQGLNGQINFSTGQELGYWLFDWQTALLADPASRGNPYLALELLGENRKTWEPILTWQTEYMKNRQLVQAATASNLMDELPFSESIHARLLVRDFYKQPALVKNELEQLGAALQNAPSLDGIKNSELKKLMQVTVLRLKHALALREAATHSRGSTAFDAKIKEAEVCRLNAYTLIADLVKQNRYPEIPIFEAWDNPTSYDYGYLWSAARLHFWQREEQILMSGSKNPFFMNTINPLKILLPRAVYE